jgi:hypothetical protein
MDRSIRSIAFRSIHSFSLPFLHSHVHPFDRIDMHMVLSIQCWITQLKIGLDYKVEKKMDGQRSNSNDS